MDRCSFGLDGSAELVRLLIEWKIPFVLLGNYTFRTQIHVARDNGTRKGFLFTKMYDRIAGIRDDNSKYTTTFCNK
jgi:hypothetical protein